MKKRLKRCISVLLIGCLMAISLPVTAQDSSAGEPNVNLRYFVNENNIQYFLIESRLKTGRKFTSLPRQVVKLFLDSNSAGNLITKTYTDDNGKAKVIIPASLQDKWMNSPRHTLIGVLEATSVEDERTATLAIARAKISLDTSNIDGVRSVNAKVMFFDNNAWLPANNVELKIGVVRSAGLLSAGDKETYTTDSAGNVSVEFTKIGLPGDLKGNLVLISKVEDNDPYGNLVIAKTVPWGVALQIDKGFFDQRTLWSTRFKTPLWLLLMATAIITSVWGTLIFLMWQIFKIKKLGVATQL